MMDAATQFASAHPVVAFTILSALLGGVGPYLGGRGLKARAQIVDGSILRRTGYLALWFGFFVWIVREWPTVSRILRWAVGALFAAAVVAGFAFMPGSDLVTAAVVFGLWFGILRFTIWFGGLGKEITVDNIRAVRRRKAVTQTVHYGLVLTTPEGTPPRAGTATEGPNGTLMFDVRPGIGGNLDDLAEVAATGSLGNAVNQLGHRYGAGDLAVSGSVISPDGPLEGSGRLVVHVNGDPLDRVVYPPAVWPSTEPDAPLILGVDPMGEHLTLDVIDEPAVLLGGLRGTGKSSLIASILDQLAPRAHTALALMDPKRMEFAPWAQRATIVGLGRAGTDLGLRLVYCEYLARTERMSTGGGYVRKNRTGIDNPRLVTIVDEVGEVSHTKPAKENQTAIRHTLTEILGYEPTDPEAWTAPGQEILRKLVSLSRAVGMTQILCTQRPSATVLPTDIRDNCDVMLGLALRDQNGIGMVFGDAKPPCDKIPIAMKGVGYAVTQTSRDARRFRSFLVEDDRVLSTAHATRNQRVDLGWPSTTQGPKPPPQDEES